MKTNKIKLTLEQKKEMSKNLFINFFKSEICGMKMIDFYFSKDFHIYEKHFILKKRYYILYGRPELEIKNLSNNIFLAQFNDYKFDLRFLDIFTISGNIYKNRVSINIYDVLTLIKTDCKEYDYWYEEHGDNETIINEVKKLLS